MVQPFPEIPSQIFVASITYLNSSASKQALRNVVVPKVFNGTE
jgi:hypothetical protein